MPFAMNSTDYRRNHELLTDFIRRAAEMESLPAARREKLQTLWEKCRRNQFNVVLAGEFQCGKSTLFNALCDGREISPRGAMIRTSACNISATALPDATAAEYAEVEWKNECELLASVAEIWEDYTFPPQGNAATPIPMGTQQRETLHLSSPKDREKLRRMLDAEFCRYSNISVPTAADLERHQIAQVADVILTFWRDPYMENLRKRKQVSLAEVAEMTAFPENWGRVWATAGKAAAFDARNIVFAFVKSIHCHIHSDTLAQLGCTVTDCPGLFAGAWDTKVAMETLAQADGVIYLLRGETGMTAGDVQAISCIRRHLPLQMQKKIYLALNRRHGETITTGILRHDQALLRRSGMNGAISPLHILLYFLAKIGGQAVRKSLQPLSESRFRALCRRMDVDEAPFETQWCSVVNETLKNVGIRDKKINALNEKSLAALEKLSGVNNFLADLREGMLHADARALAFLRDSGARVLRAELEAFVAHLKHTEAATRQQAAAMHAEFEKAARQLAAFENQALQIFASAFPENVTDELVSEGYHTAFTDKAHALALYIELEMQQQIKQASDEVAMAAAKTKMGEIFDRVRHELYESKNEACAWSSEADALLKPMFEDILLKAYKKEIVPTLSTWILSLRNGSSETYKRYAVYTIDQANAKIREAWGYAVEEAPFLKELCPPVLPHVLQHGGENWHHDWNLEVRGNDFVQMLGADELVDRILAGILGGAIIYGGAWLLGGHQLAAVFRVLVRPLVKKAVDKKSPTTAADLSPAHSRQMAEIESKLNQAFLSAEFRQHVMQGENSLNLVTEELKKNYTDLLKTKLNNMINEFESQRRAAEDCLRLPYAALQLHAKQAECTRVNIVEPLLTEVREFESQLTA